MPDDTREVARAVVDELGRRALHVLLGVLAVVAVLAVVLGVFRYLDNITP